MLQASTRQAGVASGPSSREIEERDVNQSLAQVDAHHARHHQRLAEQ